MISPMWGPMALWKASRESKVRVPTQMLADGWPDIPAERPSSMVMALRASPQRSATIGMCLLQ